MANELWAILENTERARETIKGVDRWVLDDPERDLLDELALLEDEVVAAMLSLVLGVVNQVSTIFLEERFRFPPDLIVKTTRDVITGWARVLLNPNDPTAGDVGRRFLDVAYPNKIHPEFWNTRLGQLIFSRDGFPLRRATVREAGQVLNGLSKTAVRRRFAEHQSIVEGLAYIDRDELYVSWRADRERKRNEQRQDGSW